MQYLKIIYYLIRIKIKTKQRFGQIIENSLVNSSFELFYITDGWFYSVLKRYLDKCK